MKMDFQLNTETFLGCDKTFEECCLARLLTRRPPIAPARALPAGRCGRNPMD